MQRGRVGRDLVHHDVQPDWVVQRRVELGDVGAKATDALRTDRDLHRAMARHEDRGVDSLRGSLGAQTLHRLHPSGLHLPLGSEVPGQHQQEKGERTSHANDDERGHEERARELMRVHLGHPGTLARDLAL